MNYLTQITNKEAEITDRLQRVNADNMFTGILEISVTVFFYPGLSNRSDISWHSETYNGNSHL